jgi:hypothetical protein
MENILNSVALLGETVSYSTQTLFSCGKIILLYSQGVGPLGSVPSLTIDPTTFFQVFQIYFFPEDSTPLLSQAVYYPLSPPREVSFAFCNF